MKTLFVILLSFIFSSAFSQSWPIKSIVTLQHTRGVRFIEIPTFRYTGDRALPGNGMFQQLQLNSTFKSRLLSETPEAIRINLPVNKRDHITCDLVKVNLGNAKFTKNNAEVIEGIKFPLIYQGIVVGENNKNTVVLTVNDEYISLSLSLKEKYLQVTKANESSSLAYRLYNSEKIKFPVAPLSCGTKDSLFATTGLANPNANVITVIPSISKSVFVFVDCFDSVYLWKNSNAQQTINYVYELFNAVSAGFLNDSIVIQIAGVNIWTTPDPFRGDNRDNAVNDFADYHKNDFWGNLCVGLDYSTPGFSRYGIAKGIGLTKGVEPNTCPPNNSKIPVCYTDVDYGGSYANFPTGPNTTANAIYLVMHEMGHLLGSPHTFWCGWKLSSNPDVYGAIDSCGGVEPFNGNSCALGPPPPDTGATIMSYCIGGIGAGNFGNYNAGFGPLPGAAIRSYVSEASCIPITQNCTSLLHPKKRTNSSTDNAYEFSGNYYSAFVLSNMLFKSYKWSVKSLTKSRDNK